MKTLISTILLLFAYLNLFGQLGKRLNEFAEKNVSNIAIDRLGDFYLQFKNQSIKKYDTGGNYLYTFKPTSDSITSLHPWNPLNVFIYDRNKQTLIFLDNTLSVIERKPIDVSLAVEPALACASSNNMSYWLYDKADHTIKKINVSNETILLEIDLKKIFGDQLPDLLYMREYQNSLFLLDKKAGIKNISITGKVKHAFPSTHIANFGFVGEEFYYSENGKLIFYDFTTKRARNIEVGTEFKFAMATDERLILIGKEGKVSVWEFKP
jgi:hypothetical protein